MVPSLAHHPYRTPLLLKPRGRGQVWRRRGLDGASEHLSRALVSNVLLNRVLRSPSALLTSWALCLVRSSTGQEKWVSNVARVLAIHPSLHVPVNRHVMGDLCVPAVGGFALGKFFYFLDLSSQFA